MAQNLYRCDWWGSDMTSDFFHTDPSMFNQSRSMNQ